MKIICALLFCAIFNILATDDKLEDRKKLEATNKLLQMHVSKSTLWDRFKHFVCQNKYSMEPILERELQQGLLIESVTGNIQFAQVDDIGSGTNNVKSLGADRRILLRPHFRELLLDIIKNPESHNVTFEHTCRLLGLFLSVKDAENYSTSAVVTPPPDNTCVISHGEAILKSCKYFSRLRLVENQDHKNVKGDISLNILRY
ncbi:uncharacterized protein LOC126843252 isoform X2 [Adelges cooleyi]|uniref:uncharacterized protein LOC126843252 isoform X2 n=1 Tax=Adelges cooleyi TaxID=133065 RepID=UPI00218084B7|nr:uncharacterized protein LOC126843252 isoform X2 [Adelges cooleyi]